MKIDETATAHRGVNLARKVWTNMVNNELMTSKFLNAIKIFVAYLAHKIFLCICQIGCWKLVLPVLARQTDVTMQKTLQSTFEVTWFFRANTVYA